MKTSLSLSVIRGAALILATAVGMSTAMAQTTTIPPAKVGKKKVVAAVPATPGSEAGLLDQAYGLLSSADHDYKGHRARAMHQIEEAAKALGSKLGGQGKGGEQQGTSDSQVKNAQSLLQQAVSGVTGKPHHHIEEALKQLSIALTVK